MAIYAWIALLGAGISEVLWVYFMKQSEGFTKLTPTILFIIVILLSMGLLAYSIKHIPLSTAYPIWVGIGAVGTVFLGMFFFGEVVGVAKLFFLGMIVVGIIGLKFI